MEQLTQQQRLLADAAQANKLNIIHHAYVDISGDLVAGALLGQIIFWFGRGKDGLSRARIQKDGFLWIAKTRNDWWEEIRITPKQYDRAAKILKEKGFIELRTMKFNGNPTTHIRLIPETINKALESWKIEQVKSLLPKEEKPEIAGYSHLSNKEIDESETRTSLEDESRYLHFVDKELTEKVISSYTENTQKENNRENIHTDPLSAAESVRPINNDFLKHKEVKEQINKDFESTWAEYPRKEGKQKARNAFEKAVRGIGSRKPNGEPYTAAEIRAEVILYRQHIERQIKDETLEARYIPTGGSWFEREGWTDEIPSISSSLEFDAAIEHNKAVSELRRTAALIARSGEKERMKLSERFNKIAALMPY